jgi:subtilisin family serine protease
VAASEVVVKLERCPAETTFLTYNLRSLEEKETGDEQLTVTQVGNGCWFQIKSSTLTVAQLVESLSANAMRFRMDANTQETTRIIHTEPNFIIRISPSFEEEALAISCDDDLFQQGKLWGLDNNIHPGIDIRALDAWTISKGKRDIVAGILDTGIAYDHPDLGDNVWKATNDFSVKIGTEIVQCKTGTHGYNAVQKATRCIPLDDNWSENRGHGTHVAGIIGALGDNKIGVKGVNWYTQLISLKVVGPFGGKLTDAVNAIEFAIQMQPFVNIRVLNASWGYRIGDVDPKDNELLREEIEAAGAKNILFVASAGNDGRDNDKVPHYPSGFDLPNVISVTAIDQDGALAKIFGSLSNFGKKSVHLGAPGTSIYSTYPIESGYCYHRNSGTSMAAPFVSGVAALILSVPGCAGLSATQVKEAILRGTVPTTSLVNTATGGRLNAYNSIQRCSSP